MFLTHGSPLCTTQVYGGDEATYKGPITTAKLRARAARAIVRVCHRKTVLDSARFQMYIAPYPKTHGSETHWSSSLGTYIHRSKRGFSRLLCLGVKKLV